VLNSEQILNLISNRFLELIILPTEQCNFRCTYCYEDFSIGKMKPNIVQAIKNLVSKRAQELSALKISWFGGEPLAAKDIVYDISEYIIHLKKRYNFDYSSGMTTNGFTLNEEVLRKLVSLGTKHYQISLDGTEALHNKTRIRMNGTGTFEKIWHNLLTAKSTDLDFSIMIRIHITPDNIENIYELTDKIKQTFGYDKRFSIFYKAIENLGGPNGGTFKTLHGKDKKEIISQIHAYLGETLKGKKIDDYGQYVCYAAQTNSFVIRSNGKIGKCTVAFSDDRNSLGNLNDDGTMNIAPDKLALWTRGIKSQDKLELECPMYKLPKLITKLREIPVRVNP
jgi:uncharacterized protein